jgi:hypothetical protein
MDYRLNNEQTREESLVKRQEQEALLKLDC